MPDGIGASKVALAIEPASTLWQGMAAATQAPGGEIKCRLLFKINP